MSDIVFDLIDKELHRQQTGIELIASENFTSENVMRASGSVLTNKYAEGLPNKRYYGGCEIVDQIEQELLFCSSLYLEGHLGMTLDARKTSPSERPYILTVSARSKSCCLRFVETTLRMFPFLSFI